MNNVSNDKYVNIKTYGCQMNENDSEIMLGILKELGYTETDDEKKASLIIYNTCSVRENADNKVFGELGRMKLVKRTRPQTLLALCGCMAQQKSVVDRIMKSYQHLDIVFGTHNIHEIPRLISEAEFSKQTIIDVWQTEGEIVENQPKVRKDGIKAWIPVMYGCNNFCTYCIVPYTRGRERSRLVSSIKKEVLELVEAGYKEVTLLGQNVNSYGHDLDGNISFTDLLKELDTIGIQRIRFMTSHPKDFNDELIATIKDSKHICEHIHLPFQAGSNDVLNLMNRRHSRESYLQMIDKVKKQLPEASLSTDIIVGFPGETEDNFLDTLDLVRQVEFDTAYTFIYSARTGTPAADMEDNVEHSVKKERLQRLIELQNDISKKKNQQYLNKTIEVLVEGYSKNNPSKLAGRTRTNKVVNFTGDIDMVGQLIDVKIELVKSFSLEGKIIGGFHSA